MESHIVNWSLHVYLLPAVPTGQKQSKPPDKPPRAARHDIIEVQFRMNNN